MESTEGAKLARVQLRSRASQSPDVQRGGGTAGVARAGYHEPHAATPAPPCPNGLLSGLSRNIRSLIRQGPSSPSFGTSSAGGLSTRLSPGYRSWTLKSERRQPSGKFSEWRPTDAASARCMRNVRKNETSHPEGRRIKVGNQTHCGGGTSLS